MTYKTNEKTPTWIRLILGEIGLGEEFEFNKITGEQHKKFQTLEKLIDAVEDNRLIPIIKKGKVGFIRVNDHEISY